MHNDTKLIAEAYDQQIRDMHATMNAPPESRDSGSVPLDDGYYFEWWRDVQENIHGTIYDENGDFATDEIDMDITDRRKGLSKYDHAEHEKDIRVIGLRSLMTHKARARWFGKSGDFRRVEGEFTGKIITTIKEVEDLPEKTIIWYPEHAMMLGSYLTRNALLVFLSENDHYHEDFSLDPKTRQAISQASKETGGSIDPPTHADDPNMTPILTPSEIYGEDDVKAIVEFADRVKAEGWGFATVPYSTAPEIRNKWSFD